MPISAINIIVKTKLKFASKFNASYFVKTPSNDKTNVLRITQINKKFSRNFDTTN